MHAGHMIKCVTFLNTSNSMKTQNVDMSYQTFFFPSRKPRPQRMSVARRLTFNMDLHGGLRLFRENIFLFRDSGGDHT